MYVCCKRESLPSVFFAHAMKCGTVEAEFVVQGMYRVHFEQKPLGIMQEDSCLQLNTDFDQESLARLLVKQTVLKGAPQ